MVSALDPHVGEDLDLLSDRLSRFYNSVEAKQYFEKAHDGNEQWAEGSCHDLLQKLVGPTEKVLDLGCGSGHAWLNLVDKQVEYWGVDWSGTQIEENRIRFGEGPIFKRASIYATGLEAGVFDVVFSLFVLEHTVWPHRFLDEMIRLTRPGGLLFICCPEYRHFGRMPSLPHGGPGSLKDKLRGARWMASVRHLVHRILWPRVLSRWYPRDLFPFLINLQPMCFRETYDVDNDAVYFVDRDECVTYLNEAGADDITDVSIREYQPGLELDRGTCLIVMRTII